MTYFLCAHAFIQVSVRLAGNMRNRPGKAFIFILLNIGVHKVIVKLRNANDGFGHMQLSGYLFH